MVFLNRIYTRGGDDGKTGIIGDIRLSKSHALIDAIGEIDETNAAIGVALAKITDPFCQDRLGLIQNDLFDLGADLATPFENKISSSLRITASQVERLELEIDRINQDLPALKSFILPQGQGGIAELHLARAIARRAERALIRLNDSDITINAGIRCYVNRLSDYLFVMARWLGQKLEQEQLWEPRKGNS
ncbi:cob(I)yrinic acid a,c-diamide adenosyltransferase [Zymomonas mobilis]|uniref:cob(I)yrinic acid a,c-diamide adenosyltransferase n=1 Tax=Zymomonas mobilis TaxID=542 RepID=UPI0003C77586|nr:cob(I)yrinic acid a,c-diamide adenosyltransferase [Zymomonas mobilis]AHB10923.1 ATP:cob(I)alamin adenosyltransferase [Zymomonas mobilis subsp. mobilis str. CP4 = NRRL B-14023]AHJ71235.1 Cob(I)yrinic acid a,c-diamide adenosyltransferase [Zymomonas mobilis subsp. mobilis NRRL B-12526]TWE25471.1 ATP:cob(I)alamin adenosyltransferase [Zymomonas mobilis]